MVRIYGSYEPIYDATLKTFEAELGCELPDDYRAFLLEHNGGVPDPRSFKYIEGKDGEQVGGVYRFLSLTDDKYVSIRKYVILLQGEIIPAFLLPIAKDGVGNFIFLTIDGVDKRKVFYWQHEYHPDDGNIFFVANSFREFLDMLFEHHEDDEE